MKITKKFAYMSFAILMFQGCSGKENDGSLDAVDGGVGSSQNISISMVPKESLLSLSALLGAGTASKISIKSLVQKPTGALPLSAQKDQNGYYILGDANQAQSNLVYAISFEAFDSQGEKCAAIDGQDFTIGQLNSLVCNVNNVATNNTDTNKTTTPTIPENANNIEFSSICQKNSGFLNGNQCISNSSKYGSIVFTQGETPNPVYKTLENLNNFRDLQNNCDNFPDSSELSQDFETCFCNSKKNISLWEAANQLKVSGLPVPFASICVDDVKSSQPTGEQIIAINKEICEELEFNLLSIDGVNEGANTCGCIGGQSVRFDIPRSTFVQTCAGLANGYSTAGICAKIGVPSSSVGCECPSQGGNGLDYNGILESEYALKCLVGQ